MPRLASTTARPSATPALQQVVGQVGASMNLRLTNAPTLLTVQPQTMQTQSISDAAYFVPSIRAMALMQLGVFASIPLVALTLLVTPVCIIYSWNHFPEPRNPKALLILLLVLHTGMLGTFVAQDLILFFVFFEVVLLPMYFLIGVWGGEQRQYAAIKFFLFTLFGSALMMGRRRSSIVANASSHVTGT